MLTTTVIPVTDASDNGYASLSPGTLRAAILLADLVGPGNTAEIDFQIPNQSNPVISLKAPLPAITTDTFINGTTQGRLRGDAARAHRR